MKTYMLLSLALLLLVLPVAAQDYPANSEVKWNRITLPAGKYTIAEANNHWSTLAMLMALDMRKTSKKDCISAVHNPSDRIRQFMPNKADSGRVAGLYFHGRHYYPNLSSSFELKKRCKIRYRFIYDWVQQLADKFSVSRERAQELLSLHYVFRRVD